MKPWILNHNRLCKESKLIGPCFAVTIPSFGLLLGRYSERHIRTRPRVLTDELLQRGRVHYVEAHLSPKRAGLPVARRANRVPEEPFKGEGGTHLHHALSKNGPLAGFLQHHAGIKFHSINIPVEFFKLAGNLLVICKW